MAKKKRKHVIIHSAIHEHVHDVWPGRPVEFFEWTLGPITENVPDFRVARVDPIEPRQAWVYMSMGMSFAAACQEHPIELFILAPFEEPLHVELLAMVADYCFETKTSPYLNRIFNIGRPWCEDSECDYLLISLPYTLGPKVEWKTMPRGKPPIRCLWALPITSKEAAYAGKEGVEALEQLFDKHRINPVDPKRRSVV